MSVDLNNTIESSKSRLEAIKAFKETSADEKQLSKDKGNSLDKSIGGFATQLNKIANQQKRFQRNAPTSMDSMFDMIFGARGSGSNSAKYLRKKLLEVMVKMEPKVNDIMSKAAINALGCSQEQTYPGLNLSITPIPSIPSLPVSEGIYIPVNSIDFLGNLKLPINSLIGRFFYEKEISKERGYIPFTTTTKKLFKPYSGVLNMPINMILRERIDTNNTLYSQDYSVVYKGNSQQNLFDVSYVNSNNLGVSGDYFRVFLINRDDPTQQGINDYKQNKIGQFLTDYFKTIKLVDPVNVAASLVNYATNFIDIKVSIGYERASDKNKFSLLLQRILGLCFDSRREIDVSGIAKLAELDGVDDSFFEFTEIELREIDSTISNIQKGVVTFQDCGNVELPVNADVIVDDFIKFRNSSGTSVQDTVSNIENIIDNISKNPEWRLLIPNDVDIEFTINKNILKDLPKAVAYSILTPKTLLPIFLLMQVVEKSAKNQVNQLIQSGNTLVQSGNSYLQSGSTQGQQVNNIVNNSVDFVKKFKSFVIEVVSKINAEFLEELYVILKKDIINLLGTVLKDINKSSQKKWYAIILRLLQLILVIAQIINDYRNCKSLFDSILRLLNLINDGLGTFNQRQIPLPLLLFAQALPGTSPERMAINAIENLDKLGIPTGRGPGNKPNLMNQFMLQMFKGMEKENSENGKVEIALDPASDFIKGFGKSL